MAKKNLYRIIYINQGKVYEIYARSIAQSGMHGFVEVEDLLFGEHTSVVIDPAEERLKNEFSGVKRSYIPMHAVIRIDEVEKEGTAKIVPLEGNVSAFPGVNDSLISSGDKKRD
jgi:hypothetical protein